MTEKIRASRAAAHLTCIGLACIGLSAMPGLSVAAGAQGGAAAVSAAASAASGMDMMGSFDAALAQAVAGDPALNDFYASRGYQPIWTSAADADRRAALFGALDGAGVQGLPVTRYDAAGLRAALSTIRSEHERGLLEAKMSRVFLSYVRDATSGALDPKKVDPTIVRDVPRPDRLTEIAGFAQSTDPASFMAALLPQNPAYAQLLLARLDLAQKIRDGGWGPMVETGGALHPGDTGPRVVALRNRLQRMGYLGRSASAQYDEPMRKAVRQLQYDLGEAVDGIAGAATLAEINVAPEIRMQSILVAMERLRWMNGLNLGDRYVWVNIPDYRVKIVDHGVVTFDSVTVVGQPDPDKRTPEFSDMMRMMVINPSWHVPRSITVKEYLPMMQRNPEAAHQIQVIDAKGNVIPREAIDFNSYDASTFPFLMRQDPSDDNALGVVKFLFPNPWNIYLHDTPSKSLFSRTVRALSHGCVRVGKPEEFAYALLDGQVTEPMAYFQTVVASGKETTVKLDHPLPVHLVYFTAWPATRGRIEYRDDIYGRDAALFDALGKAGVELLAAAD